MVRQVLTAVVLATLLGLYLRTFVVQPVQVRSGSMGETLIPGDHVLVGRLIFATGGWLTPILPVRSPRRGDVVLLERPGGRLLVKRCVALPGDRVEIRRGQLVIDGRPVVEPWAQISVVDADVPEILLDEDRYFVLGDHRSESRDSRHWGPLRLGRIRGRAFAIYWSTPLGEPVNGWDRLWVRWQERVAATRWARLWRLVR